MASSWDSTPAPAGGGRSAGSSWDRTQNTPMKPVPFDDPGMLQSVLIGAGHTFDRVGKGMKQIYYGVTGDAAAQAKLAEQANYEESLYDPLRQHRPFSTGVGESLPSMVMPAGGGTTLGATVLRQALAGAIPAALSYGSAGERAQGAGWGAVSGAALPLAGAATKTVYAAAEPFMKSGQDKIIGRLMNRVAGDDAPAVIARLKAAAPVVPGSLPTAAQVAESGGIAALERSASAVNPQAYAARQVDQSLARKQALASIAGTPDQLTAAIAARKAAADPLYAAAKSAVVPVTPELQSVLDRIPSGTMTRAQRMAKMTGEALSTRDIPPSVVGNGLLDASGNAITSAVPGTPATWTGKGLHYLKMGLDDEANLAGNATSGIGKTEAGLLNGLKGDFGTQINALVPGYQQATQTFADMSKPVNQMQIGQTLYEKLAPALSDFGAMGKDTPAKYAQALRDAEQTAKTATGFPGASLADVMTPDQMGLINGVATDLGRVANAQNLGRGVGSDTAQKLAMQNIAAQSGMPGVMGLVTKIGSHPLGWVYDDVNKEMGSKLADALLNPSTASDLMSGAVPTFMQGHEQLRNALAKSLLRTSYLAGPAGASAQQVLTPALTAE